MATGKKKRAHEEAEPEPETPASPAAALGGPATGTTACDNAPSSSSAHEHPCNGPGCCVVCHSAQELEVHTASAHRFACTECKGKGKPAAFASQAILDRHIEEHHDPFFQVSMWR